MTIDAFLAQATQRLELAGIGTARLDTLVLLEDEFGHERSWLLAHPEKVIKTETLKRLEANIAQREKHQPLTYIRGFSEFYGRRFVVNKDVLEPRPESETMIELLIDLAKGQKFKANSQILDIGTGSGALAITAKLELPKATVLASDVDRKCLSIARQNAKSLKVDVKFLHGDLLQPLPATSNKLTAIMANLPYVPRNFHTNQAAAMEPRLAIDGGSDGLEVYRRLFNQLAKLPKKPGYVLTESLPPQHTKLKQIAKTAGYRLQKTDDFIQLFAV